jgi:hypothetical protein
MSAPGGAAAEDRRRTGGREPSLEVWGVAIYMVNETRSTMHDSAQLQSVAWRVTGLARAGHSSVGMLPAIAIVKRRERIG